MSHKHVKAHTNAKRTHKKKERRAAKRLREEALPLPAARTTPAPAGEEERDAATKVSAEAFADWCDAQHPAFQAESLHGEVVAMCDLVDRFRAALYAPAPSGADGGEGEGK